MKVVLIRSLAVALAVVPAVSFAQQSADAGARPITLEEAVRLAQQYSPQTVQARNAERSGEQAVRASVSQFLPNLNLSYSGTQAGGSTFFQGKLVPYAGVPWSYSRGLNSSLVLFDGGQRWYNYRSAQSNLNAADATEVSQRYNVALAVKQQYFAVLAARESEAAARRSLEQAMQNLKVAAAKTVAGAATRSDSLRATIQVSNAQLGILTAQNNLRVANAFLTRLVASPVPVTAVASDTGATGRVELDSASLAKLADEGPAVRQAAAVLAAARSGRRAATTPYLPTLSTSASYGQNPNPTENFNWGGGPAASSTRLSFNLSYPIFNNYAREQQLVAARVAEDNADAIYRDAKLAQQQSLVQDLSAIRSANERIALQLVTIASAEEDLRVQEQRYSLGASTLLDVLTSQATLDNARAALIQARFDARTAKAQIEALIGRDLQ